MANFYLLQLMYSSGPFIGLPQTTCVTLGKPLGTRYSLISTMFRFRCISLGKQPNLTMFWYPRCLYSQWGDLGAFKGQREVVGYVILKTGRRQHLMKYASCLQKLMLYTSDLGQSCNLLPSHPCNACSFLGQECAGSELWLCPGLAPHCHWPEILGCP